MDIIMPQLGETVLEGLITTWYKKPGDSIAADESLFEVETDKVSTSIPSPVPGVVREILVDAGVTVKVGTRLAVIDSPSATAAATSPATASAPAGSSIQPPSPRTDTSPKNAADAAAATPESLGRAARSANRLSPRVRRLLSEAGLEAEQVRGSGRDGRITREDMLALGGRTSSAAPSTPESPTQDIVLPLNKIRRATAAHMMRSIATSAHTLQAVEVNFHNIERVRQTQGANWQAKEGFPLTYLPFVCIAACAALAEFPLINASFSNDALIVHRRINVGIAVDLAFEGLVVPVLRDANHEYLGDAAREIHALVRKARNNSLTPDDMTGGTYTISNSGSFGTLITAPIINQPQVAILSLDGIHKKPTVLEGPDGDSIIGVRPIGVLAQSFDHRAFDGAYSAAFLRGLKQTLEDHNWRDELN